MKKSYIIPAVEPIRMEVETPLAGSSDMITSAGAVSDVTYGGQSDGTVMPEAKRNFDVWDDDWSK